MIIKKINIGALVALSFFMTFAAVAHPTGNMVTVGKNVLWSYIDPVDDPDHHACVMIWQEGSEPSVFIRSDFPASDFMLYNDQNVIYIIERRHLAPRNSFEIRILKTSIDSKPSVIWDWFKDDHRIGEGGFFMISDDQVAFGKYPDVYALKRGEKPVKYFDFEKPIKGIRAVKNNRILLLGDDSCYLVTKKGEIVKKWDDLLYSVVIDPPLNRNQIFDADYRNGKLLLSYWGNRSFELVEENGNRTTLLKQEAPLAPHWTAFYGDAMLLFSSKLIFDGSTPKPRLVLWESKNNAEIIWGKP